MHALPVRWVNMSGNRLAYNNRRVIRLSAMHPWTSEDRSRNPFGEGRLEEVIYCSVLDNTGSS
jgi:hypothetical protein